MKIHPMLVTFICGLAGDLAISFGWIIGLLLTIYFRLGALGFCLVTSGIMGIGILAILIDDVYGMQRNYGCMALFRKWKQVRQRNSRL